MREASSPVTAAFDRQREAIELTHRVVSEGADVRRRTVKSFVDTLDAHRSAGQRATDAMEGAFETTFLLANASIPGGVTAFDGGEASLQEGLDTFEEFRDAGWSLFSRSVEEGFDVYDRSEDVYADAVDATFRAAVESVDMMGDQLVGFSKSWEDAIKVNVEESSE